MYRTVIQKEDSETELANSVVGKAPGAEFLEFGRGLDPAVKGLLSRFRKNRDCSPESFR